MRSLIRPLTTLVRYGCMCVVLVISTNQPSWSQIMPTADPHLDKKRLEYAKGVIKQFGDKIPLEVQKGILAQQVTLGMPPYEASLAAGAYTFEVIADPKKWPKDADPYKVIQAQTLHPDDSQIWMIFQTATQFPEKGLIRFRVFFKGGKALEIKEVIRAGEPQ